MASVSSVKQVTDVRAVVRTESESGMQNLLVNPEHMSLVQFWALESLGGHRCLEGIRYGHWMEPLFLQGRSVLDPYHQEPALAWAQLSSQGHLLGSQLQQFLLALTF